MSESFLHKITPANSRGRDAKPRHFVSKSSQKRKNLRKSPQNLSKTRASFFLTGTTPLWYNIQGGEGDNLRKDSVFL